MKNGICMHYLPVLQISAAFQCNSKLYVHIPEAFLHVENTFQGSSPCEVCMGFAMIEQQTTLLSHNNQRIQKKTYQAKRNLNNKMRGHSACMNNKMRGHSACSLWGITK